jgi:hypothetical protein
VPLLRLLATAAAFLFCLVLGAVGGLLVEFRTAPTQTSGNITEFTLIGVLGVTLGLLVGTVIGLLLGVAVAFHVWRLLGRRSHEGGS